MHEWAETLKTQCFRLERQPTSKCLPLDQFLHLKDEESNCFVEVPLRCLSYLLFMKL